MAVERRKTKRGRRTQVSLSEAIRAALKKLGDPDAPASEVKDIVVASHPSLLSMIDNERNWNSYVSQNRDKAAEEMGLERSVGEEESRLRQSSAITYADYQTAQEFIDTFRAGDAEQAKLLLDWLTEKGVDRIRQSVDAWLSLVQSAGSVEIAQRVLSTMKERGTIC